MKPLAERLANRELIQRGDLTLAFRARDSVLDRPVFVKCLNPALAADNEIRARFEREAKAVARLDHPNLVRIYEYGEDPSEGLYMLLEWFEGKTLAQKIAGGERFSGDAFIQLTLQLLRGLVALHGVGILHRDLKPDNILARADGNFKITDFSLAALRDAPRLTHHEAIVGTPAYMSPEQAAGGVPDERSDLFSLGAVLWEAATGENPFAAGKVLETLRSVREKSLDFSHPAIQALPEKARDLLPLLLKKNPDERPASAAAALEMLGEHVPIIKTRRKITKRDLLHLAAAVFVLSVWAVLMFVYPGFMIKKPAVKLPAAANTMSMKAVSDSVVPETKMVYQEPENQTSDSPPETKHAAAIPDEKQYALRAPTTTEPMHVVVDTVQLTLITEPWAHVFCDGIQVGTTPLPAPLRLPSGKREILFRNPAFPPITIDVNLSNPLEQQTVKLADFATLVRVNVEPWGEFYVDGEHAGTTPLARPLWLSPGRHTLRVTHPQFPPLQAEIAAAAGEILTAEFNLKLAQATVKEAAH